MKLKPYGEFLKPDGHALVLRALRATDLDACLDFANDLVSERRKNPDLGVVSFDRRVTRKDERMFIERTLEGVRKKNLVSVAAFDGARMVGNCDVVRRKPSDVSHTGVLGIVVRKDNRGMGLGEAMIATALREAFRTGMWLVELQAFSNNEGAIRLYEKMGFTRSGLVPNKILRRGRHIHEVQMYIDLRASDKSTSASPPSV
jgi:RimJ/RimL family protein N-acetyltransferase